MHFVLRTKKEHQLPLISVIARLLPTYNAKTGKSSSQREVLKQVVVELCASDAVRNAYFLSVQVLIGQHRGRDAFSGVLLCRSASLWSSSGHACELLALRLVSGEL